MTLTLESLKPPLADFGRQEMASGRYATNDGVIEQALSLLVKRAHYDQWVEAMRHQVDSAIAQLDQREGVEGEVLVEPLKERLYTVSHCLGDRPRTDRL